MQSQNKTLLYKTFSNNLPLIPLGTNLLCCHRSRNRRSIGIQRTPQHSNPEFCQQWQESAANEFGRLAQGIKGRVEYTDAIDFIHFHEKPKDKKATYGCVVCTVRPQKKEQNRTRITVGGNLIDYPGDVSTRTADLTTFKTHLNSVISTPGAKYMCMDMGNFYLMTPLDEPEYMRFHISLIPDEIIEAYDLAKSSHRWFCIHPHQKAMYGLPQSGLLSNQLLRKRLAPHGYYECTHTPGLWKHESRPISFTLVVDDFGVKYINKEDAQHLNAVLRCTTLSPAIGKAVSIVVSPSNGITSTRRVYLSMPDMSKSHPTLLHILQKYGRRKHDAPTNTTSPQYGAKVQMTEPPDTTPELSNSTKTSHHANCGRFLVLRSCC
jgi:hypothetical protein